MTKKIIIGIIGFGKLGKLRFQILKKNKNIEIHKIYDPKFKNEKNSKLFCKNVSDIINSKVINTVFISTPNFLNAKLTCSSLKNKKNVFCEKPPAINLKEMTKIISYEKKYKKKLMYGFNHRQHLSIIKMKELIKTKNFGKILWARGRYGKSVSKNF